MALAINNTPVTGTEPILPNTTGDIGAIIGNHTEVVEQDLTSSTVVDIDTKIIRASQYVGSGNWTIDYYGQVKNNDDSANNLDIASSIAMNQYYHIKNLDVDVTQPIVLAGNLNDTKFIAVIPVGITPIVGDVITAFTMAGELGIYRISTVHEHSIARDRLYQVKAELDGLFSTNQAIFTNLKQKVVREYIYDRSLENKIIKIDAYAQIRDIRKHIYDISYWYKSLYSVETGLISADRVYDPYAVMLMEYLVPDLHDNEADFKDYTNNTSNHLKSTIMDAIIHKVPLYNIRKRNYRDNAYETYTRAMFNRRLSYQSLYNLDKYINCINVGDDSGTTQYNPVVRNAVLPQHQQGDKTYLVTSAFYEDDLTVLSPIEKALRQLMANEIITNLDEILDAYRNFTTVELYQYCPIIVALGIYTITQKS